MFQENIKFIIPFIIQNKSIVDEKILTDIVTGKQIGRAHV